jgi:hypothetical protein
LHLDTHDSDYWGVANAVRPHHIDDELLLDYQILNSTRCFAAQRCEPSDLEGRDRSYDQDDKDEWNDDHE